MFILFNIVLILLVALIAYWWANQGLFSAFLHMLCVIVAGAIAIGAWEPIVVNFLLTGGWFDDYAWGITLVGVFSVALFILRMGMDKLAPSNVNFPEWANYVFGGAFGAFAGILSIGIVVIGGGFMQSHQEIAGYLGYGRARGGEVGPIGPQMWLPIHKWTNDFYSYLSVGALYPTLGGAPLRHHNPELHRQASQLRDSYDQGRGKFSLAPDAASVRSLLIDPTSNRHFVEVDLKSLARDYGTQVTLSQAQIRLICQPSSSLAKPVIVHPDAWRQPTAEDPSMQRFRFDDPSHFVTTIPGRESGTAIIEFPVPQDTQGRFIQIRGTRFRLPQPQAADPGAITQVATPNTTDISPPVGGAIDSAISVTTSIRPVSADINSRMGTLQHEDRWLTEGEGMFFRSAARASKAMQLLGIHQPVGTAVVQVDVSRQSPANIFGSPFNEVPDSEATLQLVDSEGYTYSPIGYLHEHAEGITIKLDPQRMLRTADEVPLLPTSGSEKLRLIFRVTAGVRIVAFRYGDITVGTASVDATPIER